MIEFQEFGELDFKLKESNKTNEDLCDLKKTLEKELTRSRSECSTNNSFEYAYSYGVKFAIKELKKLQLKRLLK